jgi:lysyl-tRNA synthetase class 2
MYFKIFLSQIEEKLGLERPTFLYRYPASQAALARRSADDPRWADRVELYVGPFELANGFAELCDSEEQRQRFLEEQTLRQKQGRMSWALDERFLEGLPKMDNAAGIAFGVERLIMLLVGTTSINDILPFPARERFNPLPEKK